MITKTAEIERLQAELEKAATSPHQVIVARDERQDVDPKAAYAVAAKAHDDLIRRFGEAAARAAHLRTAIANIRESGVGNILGGESAEDCLARTQPRLDTAEAEVRRLGAECDAANEVASRARAAMTGETYIPAHQAAVKPAPEPSAAVAVARPLTDLDRALASGEVIWAAEHKAAITAEVEGQHRWFDRAETAEREVARLQRLVDHATVERTDAVLETLAEIPAQRTARHDKDCWQRHIGCLARRVRDLLDAGVMPR